MYNPSVDDASRVVKVKRGSQRNAFTQKQWDDLGLHKDGWEIDDSPTPEILELREQKAREQAYQRADDRRTILRGLGFKDMAASKGVVFDHPVMPIEISKGDLHVINESEWPVFMEGIQRQLQMLKAFDNQKPKQEPKAPEVLAPAGGATTDTAVPQEDEAKKEESAGNLESKNTAGANPIEQAAAGSRRNTNKP